MCLVGLCCGGWQVLLCDKLDKSLLNLGFASGYWVHDPRRYSCLRLTGGLSMSWVFAFGLIHQHIVLRHRIFTMEAEGDWKNSSLQSNDIYIYIYSEDFQHLFRWLEVGELHPSMTPTFQKWVMEQRIEWSGGHFSWFSRGFARGAQHTALLLRVLWGFAILESIWGIECWDMLLLHFVDDWDPPKKPTNTG